MAIKLVTRAQWGARAYRKPNGATGYSRARRGVKLHYLGSAYSDRPHDQCDDYIRQIQNQHMDGNGWSDIGYSFLVCTHGYVYEGRGLKRRNSANGSTALNEQDYAVCLLVGSSGLTKPTDAQLHGARDAIDYCREEGPAGTWLGGHRDGYATSCPGDVIYAWVKAGAPRPTSPEEDDMPLTKADVKTMFTTDDVLDSPDKEHDPEGNLYWTAESYLRYGYLLNRDTQGLVKALAGKLDAQNAAIGELAKTVATLAVNTQAIDPDALVARIQGAIESVTVHLDVPDAQS